MVQCQFTQVICGNWASTQLQCKELNVEHLMSNSLKILLSLRAEEYSNNKPTTLWYCIHNPYRGQYCLDRLFSTLHCFLLAAVLFFIFYFFYLLLMFINISQTNCTILTTSIYDTNFIINGTRSDLVYILYSTVLFIIKGFYTVIEMMKYIILLWKYIWKKGA